MKFEEEPSLLFLIDEVVTYAQEAVEGLYKRDPARPVASYPSLLVKPGTVMVTQPHSTVASVEELLTDQDKQDGACFIGPLAVYPNHVVMLVWKSGKTADSQMFNPVTGVWVL